KSRSAYLGPVEDDLAGMARTHRFKAAFEFAIWEAVGDDGRNVHARFEHDAHFVPGLVHFATIDALDGDHVEDHLPPIHHRLGGRHAVNGDFAAVAHV